MGSEGRPNQPTRREYQMRVDIQAEGERNHGIRNEEGRVRVQLNVASEHPETAFVCSPERVHRLRHRLASQFMREG